MTTKSKHKKSHKKSNPKSHQKNNPIAKMHKKSSDPKAATL